MEGSVCLNNENEVEGLNKLQSGDFKAREEIEIEDAEQNEPGNVNCSQQMDAEGATQKCEQSWFARQFDLFGFVGNSPATGLNRRRFPVQVSFRLAVQLVVGSFCCMALAMQGTEPVWLLMRILLAVVSIAGFSRLFESCRAPPLYRRTQIPMLCIANYFKIVLVAGAATVAATAATIAATTAMMVTAAAVYWRAAWDYGVGRERRRWYANLGSFVLELMELGALLLQMILMTQVETLPR